MSVVGCPQPGAAVGMANHEESVSVASALTRPHGRPSLLGSLLLDIMAEPLNPTDPVTLDELAISTMGENTARVEV